MNLKDKLNQIKTLYIGTSDELKEKVDSGFGFKAWAIGDTIGWVIPGAVFLVSDDYYKSLALSAPVFIDLFSRLYCGINQKFHSGPEHTPNIIGQIREYLHRDKSSKLENEM